VDFKPDVILHVAAMPDVDTCEPQPTLAFQVNKYNTRYVAEATRRAGATLVYVSVFDGTTGAPEVETNFPNPINVYRPSKLAGEQAAQEAER
jgi:dTDP-4-dehydrorhamnose reductase